MRKLTIARSAEEMNVLRSAWNRLAGGRSNTIFQRFEWNQAAARIFADSHPAFVVMAESDAGICIIPASIDTSNQRISLLGEELFDYRHFLHEGDESLIAAAWQPLRDFASAGNLGLGFHAVRSDAGMGNDWVGRPLLPFTNAPCVRVATALDCRHASLEANLRQMSRLGISLQSYTGPDTQLLQKIYSYKAQEMNSLFSSCQRVHLVMEMCCTAGPACEIFTLERGSALAAALVTFRDRGWRRFYTTYFDRAWSKHSPGVTLLYAVMRQTLAAGLNCDLMTGEQPYKLRLADSSVPLFKVHAAAEDLRKGAVEGHSDCRLRSEHFQKTQR